MSRSGEKAQTKAYDDPDSNTITPTGRNRKLNSFFRFVIFKLFFAVDYLILSWQPGEVSPQVALHSSKFVILRQSALDV